MGKEEQKKPKLVVLLGPTASGKTEWSLKLARKYNGDIISADSRQIYKKMDIGTAKSEGEWKQNGLRKTYYVENIPHHLIDFLNPGKTFTVANFRDAALKYIKMSYKKGLTPFIVGGTGLYIQALVDNYDIPRIPENKKLRRSLEKKDASSLFYLLTSLDPGSAKKIDKNNKRRIIRALEVTIMSGEPFSAQQRKGDPIFDVLKIGIVVDKETLYDRINKRVDKMIEKGLLEEVKILVKQKYGWNLPSMSGVGYRQFKPYFEGEKELEEVVEDLKRDTRRYAKRQLTWFKRDKDIKWCKDYKEAEKLVDNFLTK